MARRSHGRGAVAALGLLVLFAGLVGGAVLWLMSAREANRAAEGFARAAPGCTTTLTFTEVGEYYVYEELSGIADSVAGCEPTASDGSRFAFVVNRPDGSEVDVEIDGSITYDLDAGTATSIGRIDIDRPGAYEISVVGSDPAVVAAIGGDPEERVPTLRNAAIAAAIVGVVVGGLLLVLSGWRSRKAARFDSPLDPGWGVTERDRARRTTGSDDWPPAVPSIGGQVPVNPHDPEGRRVAEIARPDGATTSTTDATPSSTTASSAAADPTPPSGVDGPSVPADAPDTPTDDSVADAPDGSPDREITGTGWAPPVHGAERSPSERTAD